MPVGLTTFGRSLPVSVSELSTPEVTVNGAPSWMCTSGASCQLLIASAFQPVKEKLLDTTMVLLKMLRKSNPQFDWSPLMLAAFCTVVPAISPGLSSMSMQCDQV